MKMSTRGRYGLRVMMELAGNFGKGPTLVAEIAKSQGISCKYMHALVTALKKAGLVRTVRGPRGGCELTGEPSSITALDVVSALEGRITPVTCTVKASFCLRAERCAARDVWCDVASAVKGVLAGVTLEGLAARQRAKNERPAEAPGKKGFAEGQDLRGKRPEHLKGAAPRARRTRKNKAGGGRRRDRSR